jgi:hypothetical protein
VAPFEAPARARIEARAVRYGWAESEITETSAPPP